MSTTETHDLSDPLLYAEGSPEPLWASLRAEHEVFRTVRLRGDFWSVLGFEPAQRALKDTTTFCSAQGMRLDADPAAVAASAGKMLIVTDAPRHAQVRRILGSAFTPRMVARLTDTVRATVTELLEQALEQGTCEFTEVAARLPMSVICDLLGVPKQDWELMLELTRTAFGATNQDESQAARAHTEILLYYDELLRRRRRRPAEDLVSVLAAAEIDGVPLSDEEIFLNCDGLISGGNETTRHATVGGMSAFLADPAQWRMLDEQPGLLAGAVQEILRYTSPALHVLRTATADTELAGVPIAAGDQVAVWIAAANRDQRVFPRPDEFDITRTSARHLTFAAGPHFCLGAALATTELTVMFEELRARVGEMEQNGPARRLRSNLIWGFESLPVRLARR